MWTISLKRAGQHHSRSMCIMFVIVAVMSEVSKDHFLDMLRDKNGANQAAKAKDKGEDSSTVTLTKKVRMVLLSKTTLPKEKFSLTVLYLLQQRLGKCSQLKVSC